MSKASGLVMFIPLYFIAMLLVYYIALSTYEEQSVEEYRLQIATNYSVDSAVEDMLGSGDLGMDYADWGKVKIDPKLAVDEFVNTFALNYDITLNNTARQQIKSDYIKLFVVCAYDGYYVYYSNKISPDGDFQLVSTPKLPYTYTDGTSYYALNLGLRDAFKFSSLSRLSKVNSPLGENKTLSAINERVSDDIAYRLDSMYKNGALETFYIPSGLSAISTTNPIVRPSVLVFLDDLDITTSRKIQAFSIGGTRITQARGVAAYTRNGEKYYCYSDLLPESLFSATNADGSKTFIENMYTTVTEAALAGYHHDPLYMN